jgi:hypothetical protein
MADTPDGNTAGQGKDEYVKSGVGYDAPSLPPV